MLYYSKIIKGTPRYYKFGVVYFSSSRAFNQIAKPVLRKPVSREIGPFGWFLLIIPVSTFGLGTWQVQRKKWKEDLLVNLRDKTRSDPVKLPEKLEDIEKLEYRPVHVKGHYLHEKELYLGPRSLLVEGDASTESSLISKGSKDTQGYLVLTPFKLADREETILVNRGWVPSKLKDPKSRKDGQIKGEIDVIGIVRLHENRPTFMPKNKDKNNFWFYRDLNQMCQVTGAAPIFIDATTDFDVPNGPIGGQTRISLRNEHLSYILTWYGLSILTSYMWYTQFIKVK